MPYLNLKGEMARRNVTIENIAELLLMHRNSISKKISGQSSFSIEEAFAIWKAYFKDCNIEWLFKRETTKEKA